MNDTILMFVCLSAEVIPKKYPRILGHTSDVMLETSGRPLHIITTEIFKIFLIEVLGFAGVTVFENDDDFDLDTVIRRITPSMMDESDL